MNISTTLNASFPKKLRQDSGLLRGSGSAFRRCAYVGMVWSVGVTTILAAHLRLSLWTVLWIISSVLLTFLGRVMFSRVIGRAQQLVFYRHFMTVIGVASTLLWLMGHPILPYLDVTVLGISAFVACGRIGCLKVGCCHGRPWRFGISYREEHVSAAFPRQFLGVRLFPIQTLESLWLVCIVIGGCYQIWHEHVPGAALGWFVATYCPARFAFEFVRWRPERSYTLGLSEAQWTSLMLASFVGGLEFFGVLPLRTWHVVALGGLGAAATAIVLRCLRRTHQHHLQDPDHVKEIAEAVALSDLAAARVAFDLHSPTIADVYLGCTSLGVQISASKMSDVTGDIYHYSFSRRNGSLTDENAGVLAQLILQMTKLPGTGDLVKGNRGVFHLLIRPGS